MGGEKEDILDIGFTLGAYDYTDTKLEEDKTRATHGIRNTMDGEEGFMRTVGVCVTEGGGGD